jgi:hypothetical protein
MLAARLLLCLWSLLCYAGAKYKRGQVSYNALLARFFIALLTLLDCAWLHADKFPYVAI